MPEQRMQVVFLQYYSSGKPSLWGFSGDWSAWKAVLAFGQAGSGAFLRRSDSAQGKMGQRRPSRILVLDNHAQVFPARSMHPTAHGAVSNQPGRTRIPLWESLPQLLKYSPLPGLCRHLPAPPRSSLVTSLLWSVPTVWLHSGPTPPSSDPGSAG